MGFNSFKNEETYWSNFKLISIITAVSVTILLSLSQTGWAAVVFCPATPVCNGTSGDDMMFGAGANQIIHGLEGNDYIRASASSNIWGDDGDDTLIGAAGNDYLDGGMGNDRYDGGYGADTIWENNLNPGDLVNNKDVISGGEGDDYIQSGSDADRIAGGPGNDYIYSNGFNRDFSFDSVNCGAGTDRIEIYSNDGDTATNCEAITDFDR